MRAARVVSLASIAALAACGGEEGADRGREAAPAEAPRAEIVQPADSDTVIGPELHVMLRASGVIVEPALGERVEGRGHHHLFVDKDVTPPGEAIPKQVDGVIHLGTGAEEFTVKGLRAGKHRMIAVLAYGDHVPMEGVATDTVHLVVRAP